MKRSPDYTRASELAAQLGYLETRCTTCIDDPGVMRRPNANSPTGWTPPEKCINCEGWGYLWRRNVPSRGNMYTDRDLVRLFGGVASEQ